MFIDITTPIGAIGLENAQALPTGTRAEFERTASIDGHRGPCLAISGSGVETTTTAFRRSPYLKDVTLIDESESRSVYRLSWRDERPALLRSISEGDGTILSAVAVDDTASLELRFPDRLSASRFYAEHDDRVHPVAIRRSSPDSNARRTSDPELTSKQREALCRALDAGYFEIPRRISLIELANEFDITDTAMSERLRRGTAVLVRNVDCEP